LKIANFPYQPLI